MQAPKTAADKADKGISSCPSCTEDGWTKTTARKERNKKWYKGATKEEGITLEVIVSRKDHDRLEKSQNE